MMATILHLVSDLGPNGAAKQLALVGPALARDGVRVHVAAMRAGDLFAAPLQAAGVPVHFLGGIGWFDPKSLLALGRLLAELRPDAVHAWRRPALRLAAALQLYRRMPLSGGDLFADRRAGNRLDAFLRKRLAHVIATGPAERGVLNRLGIDDSRIVEIPFAVDLAVDAADRRSALRELSLPETARVIACAGAIEQGKGFHESVWIFDILKYVYPDLWLLVIGDGPERTRIEAFARKLGREDYRVSITGWRRDVPQLLRLAEVVWIAGARGGRNVALEALAAGRPVVAADRPELRELLSGDASLFAPHADRHEFARATRRLLDNPALAQQFAAAARQRAERYRVETIAGQWRALF